MQILVSNVAVDIKTVAFSERGFGKKSDLNMLSYVLTVDADDFVEKFTPVYMDCVEELKRDDNIVGVFHPPYFGALSYPTVEEFFQIPSPCRMEMVDAYFVFDILRFYIEEDRVGLGEKWVVSSLDSLDLHGGALLIKGMVRSTLAI